MGNYSDNDSYSVYCDTDTIAAKGYELKSKYKHTNHNHADARQFTTKPIRSYVRKTIKKTMKGIIA